MVIEHNSNLAEWTPYYPYGKPERTNMIDKLAGSGIATIAEYYFLKELKKKYPKVTKIAHSGLIKKPRINQLKNRKMNMDKDNIYNRLSYSLDEELLKLRKKIAKNKLKEASLRQKFKWKVAKTKRKFKSKAKQIGK